MQGMIKMMINQSLVVKFPSNNGLYRLFLAFDVFLIKAALKLEV